VSDIGNLRLNINPTNLVPQSLAKRLWRSAEGDSGIKAWDLITPNRASSNIGEFAVVLPGEESVVLTKEVFVLRIAGGTKDGWDPFYLLWALCLKAVRLQWQRVALMQTNREDVGDRYKEIRLPKPKSKDWARKVSAAFRAYFESVAESKGHFREAVRMDSFDYIASVHSDVEPAVVTDTAEAAVKGKDVDDQLTA
jgi:type I restriction enzyme M protein